MKCFFYSLSLIIFLQLKIAIGKELKEPKDLIVNTFTSHSISVIKTGSIVAATLILAATIARGYSVVSTRQSTEVDRLLGQAGASS